MKNGKGDLWDSGKVSSGRTTFIPYNGKPLTSDLICYWKVKVWDQKGAESEYSNVNYWGMGLLNKSDWKGVWIGAPNGTQENALKGIADADKQV